jgi:hypothetical protein
VAEGAKKAVLPKTRGRPRKSERMAVAPFPAYTNHWPTVIMSG